MIEFNDNGIVEVEVEYRSGCEDLPLPSYQTEHAAGMDLLAAIDEMVTVKPMERRRVPTGIKIAIPPGYEGQVRPRSGLAMREGIILPNSPGTIDADYRGEVEVILMNLSQTPFTIRRGDRIAQLVICPVARCEWKVTDSLPETARGEGGFGHTGVAANESSSQS